MKSLTVIGLMSGTSADGIDAVFARFAPDLSFELIDKYFYKYEPSFQNRIFNLFRENVNLAELCQINFDIAEKFTEAANILISRNEKPDLIASHGQTIHHIPQKSTLQLGEASVIAQKTGILTISNFRARDIAAGGHGAPLVCFADEKWFKRLKKTVAVQNIGGMANVTMVGADFDTFGFDTGVGNALLDYYARRFFNAPYDKDGVFSSAGNVNEGWLEVLLSDEYYSKKPPKTTGREYFSKFYAEKALRTAPESAYDIMATACALTAKTIADAVKEYKPEEMILGGGGAKNPTILKFLRKYLPETTVIKSHEDYGIDSDFKEALAFALLGYTSYWGIPNNLPLCTGASRRVVLGEATL